MSTTTLLLAAWLHAPAALIGCGGGAQPEPPPEAPPPEPAGPSLPPLTCPEGSTYAVRETPKGIEQVCEISGVLHGPFRRWYDENTREVDGAFEHGATHGNWVWWYPDGTKRSKGSFTHGKQSGSWTFWYENGQKSEEGDFLAGRKAGTWTRYYESGRKRDEGLYHNGLKNGVWTYFRDDAENTVKRREQWQAGARKEVVYFAADGTTKIDKPLPEDVDEGEGEDGAAGSAPPQ